jgi:hypothetical protein
MNRIQRCESGSAPARRRFAIRPRVTTLPTQAVPGVRRPLQPPRRICNRGWFAPALVAQLGSVSRPRAARADRANRAIRNAARRVLWGALAGRRLPGARARAPGERGAGLCDARSPSPIHPFRRPSQWHDGPRRVGGVPGARSRVHGAVGEADGAAGPHPMVPQAQPYAARDG